MRGMTLFAITALAAVTASPAAAQVRTTDQGSGRPISFAFGGGAKSTGRELQGRVEGGMERPGLGDVSFRRPSAIPPC